jgi:hypothetical protein
MTGQSSDSSNGCSTVSSLACLPFSDARTSAHVDCGVVCEGWPPLAIEPSRSSEALTYLAVSDSTSRGSNRRWVAVQGDRVR